ncbi:unnamed protein product, partial [Darwinula stevensoni]
MRGIKEVGFVHSAGYWTITAEEQLWSSTIDPTKKLPDILRELGVMGVCNTDEHCATFQKVTHKLVVADHPRWHGQVYDNLEKALSFFHVCLSEDYTESRRGKLINQFLQLASPFPCSHPLYIIPIHPLHLLNNI